MTNNYKIVAESILIITATVIIAYSIYKTESQASERTRINEQFEILKNFIYDLNQNYGHIKGVARKFYEANIPKIKENLSKISNDDPFKIEIMSALHVVELNKDYTIESYKRIQNFFRLLETTCNKYGKSHGDYIVFHYFTFNLHSDLLHAVFNNFRQFNLKEFRDLRPNLLELRHIYDVYITNIGYLSNNVEHTHRDMEVGTYKKKTREFTPGETRIRLYPSDNYNRSYLNRGGCLYLYVFDFAKSTSQVLNSLLKHKKLRYFIEKERKNLSDLHELLED